MFKLKFVTIPGHAGGLILYLMTAPLRLYNSSSPLRVIIGDCIPYSTFLGAVYGHEENNGMMR